MTRDLPEKFAEFGDARKNGFLKVKGIKEQGGRIAGIFCTFTPSEILDAAGFTPVSLCGMSGETIGAAEADLPKNLCPLIKSSYGFALTDKCPYTYFSDLIVGETTCDGKKKMYELLNDIRPTYVIKLPQGMGPDTLKEWTAELRRFKEYLEKTFDIPITDEALRQAARQRNEERRERMALMEMQKQDPPVAKGYDFYKTLEGSGFLFDHEERMEKFRSLRKEVEQAAQETGGIRGTKRILITGCPIGGVMEKTVKAIEQCGGTVVCFENCAGIKAAYQMVDEEAEDIMEAIAERYLNIGCAVMTPNTLRMDLLKKLVTEYKVDGVVEIDLQACTPYTVESRTVAREMEKLGLHCLTLETDYSTGDAGQLATRLEAFMEML